MTSPSVPARRRRSLPGTWWGIALVVAVPVIVLAAAAIAILLLTVHPVDAKDRIELIKAGLGVGAGTGGVVALVLAGRRQWATEEANRITEHDATERRATELYAKAAEQLGSDQAPVRLSGLYALERLGDAHPTLRQTVVNLLCAYLRMPFDHRGEPAEAGNPDSEYHITAGHRQEREVRLAAQTILTDHLKFRFPEDLPTVTRWERLDLNLAGATLIDFNLVHGAIGRATFNNATFVGGALFTNTAFDDHATFLDARFLGPADFRECEFHEAALFTRATFEHLAHFQTVYFHHQVFFTEAHFVGAASFREAHFLASFTRGLHGVEFDQARFEGGVDFAHVYAATPTTFVDTIFSTAVFDGAEFTQGVTGLAETAATQALSTVGATSNGEPLEVGTMSRSDDEVDSGSQKDQPR
ncbi:MAG TPA: pentapeptide repeat-containing protein [Amycolatopsis sp.]|nr:pentapeptide repeat-containing protein [Amycolatopsis sp.]